MLPAVGLIVVLALLAFQAAPALGTNTDPLARLDQSNFGSHSERLANDLVSHAQREVLLAPATGDGVNIRAADTTGLNLDIDVVVAKWLWLVLILVEGGPGVSGLNLEAGEGLWINHFCSIQKKKRKRNGGEIIERSVDRATPVMGNVGSTRQSFGGELDVGEGRFLRGKKGKWKKILGSEQD